MYIYIIGKLTWQWAILTFVLGKHGMIFYTHVFWKSSPGSLRRFGLQLLEQSGEQNGWRATDCSICISFVPSGSPIWQSSIWYDRFHDFRVKNHPSQRCTSRCVPVFSSMILHVYLMIFRSKPRFKKTEKFPKSHVWWPKGKR